MQVSPVNHAYLRRRLDSRTFEERGLEERDPSLINLPISIPSIPILGPLLTPLIGGSTSTSTPAASPTATDSATSTSSSPTESSGGSSSSQNGSGGQSSSGSTSASSGSQSSNGGSSAGSNPSDGNTGGNTSSSDSGNNSSGGGDGGPASSSGNTIVPSGSSPSLTATVTRGTDLSAVSSANGAKTVSSAVSTSSHLIPVANVGSQASATSESSSVNNLAVSSNSHTPSESILIIPTSTTKSSPTSTSPAVDSSSGTGTQINGTGSESGLSSSSHQQSGLSGGGIAGIVIGIAALLLFVVLFIFRRRVRAQRKAEQSAWWTGGRGSPSFNAIVSSNGSGTASARSSFADRGMMGTPLPPHIRSGPEAAFATSMPLSISVNQGQNVPVPLFSAGIISPPPATADPFSNAHRVSALSRSSTSSDIHAPYLVANNGGQLVDLERSTAPISVRPFSGSDSYAFPVPPSSNHSDGGSTRYGYGPSVLGHFDNGSTMSASAASATSGSAAFVTAESDSDPSPHALNPIHNQALQTPDPFADAYSTDNGSIVGSDEEALTYVYRPFVPTMTDELGVTVGEMVRINRVFDDGWALVDKGGGVQGLVPAACFRNQADQLPAVLATRRVSYGLAYAA